MPFQTLPKDEFLKTEIVNVATYGAIGDGINDDSSAILQAISAASNNILLFPTGTYKISSDIAVPSDIAIWFVNGAELSVDSNKTFTINGKLEAGLYQIFSGSGTISIARGACDAIIPQWWGAVGDGSNDDTSAIQSAINAANETGTTKKVREVFLPNGCYKITSPLSITTGTSLRGNGMNSTIIDVYGGGNGIELGVTVTSSVYENTTLSDFRLRSQTAGSGIGIRNDGLRGVSIEHVHIGGWYTVPERTKGFLEGIHIEDNSAYYCTIRRCLLMYNTYGIYLKTGANDARIVENDIWYGDYAIYIEGGSATRILNNTLEGFAQRGVYTNSNFTLVWGNYIESSGVYSVELGPNSRHCAIQQSACVTGFGNGSDVLNNSDGNYHWINDNQIPIGWISQNDEGDYALAGLISCNLYNYHVKDMKIEALTGDLELKTNPAKTGKVIELDGASEAYTFNSPVGGFGYKTNNIAVNGWTNNQVTVTSNAAVAPDGTITARKIVENNGATNPYTYTYNPYTYTYVLNQITTGDVINFSIWAKADADTIAHIAIFDGSTAVATLQPVMLTTTWKRYNLTYIAERAHTWTYFYIFTDSRIPIYTWGQQVAEYTSVTGTDNSGVNDKATRIIDTTKNFKTSGIDIGGLVIVPTNPVGTGSARGTISDIHSILNFTGGTGTEPSADATITGGTSATTGNVELVVITSGSFSSGDAAGYIVYSAETGTFTTETITWTGGSATIASINLNSVLETSLAASWGTKADCDNGNTYYVCPRFATIAPPYIPAGLAGITAGSTAVNCLTATTIYAPLGYQHGILNYNPMTGNANASDGYELIIVNPDATRNLNFTNYDTDGSLVHIKNISSTNTLTTNGGISDNVLPNHVGIYQRVNSTWYTLFNGQPYLRTSDTPTFAGVTATAGRVNAKTINGAVSALTYASTIACDMNTGNVFTTTTTSAVGNAQINASNGVAGQEATFIITNDADGARTITFGTNFKPNGTLVGTVSKSAVVKFVYNGSYWYEVSRTTGL